jgi:hypothetical protein
MLNYLALLGWNDASEQEIFSVRQTNPAFFFFCVWMEVWKDGCVEGWTSTQSSVFLREQDQQCLYLWRGVSLCASPKRHSCLSVLPL